MDGTEYKDAVDGDIYFNPVFGDFWIVEHGCFVKINDGLDFLAISTFSVPLPINRPSEPESYVTPFDDPCGFIRVGHAEWSIIRNTYSSF